MPSAVISEADAVARFPELHELPVVRWNFHLLLDEDGVFSVAASHHRAGCVDAVFVGRGWAFGLRVVPHGDGGVVWAKQGAVGELVREMADLPLPGEPGAPSAVVPVADLLKAPADLRGAGVKPGGVA